MPIIDKATIACLFGLAAFLSPRVPCACAFSVSPLFATVATSETTSSSSSSSPSLTDLFPDFGPSIENLGISTPTPIQQSSAERALDRENLLLVAPTGSGKTLAYLFPALKKAADEDGTILIVAPTRELAVQLLRDTSDLIGDSEEIRLAVRGVDTPVLDDKARILIGTPPEIYNLVYNERNSFLNAISTVILDEVDVLLPPAPKTLRTALDETGGRAKTSQGERRKKEQKRKMNAARRKGAQLDDDTNRILSDTENILGMVANLRLENVPQVLAGSATASRKTLDRLNQALRTASRGAAIPLGVRVQLCRPAADTEGAQDTATAEQHTIRAVTVPNEVKHCVVTLEKEAASDPKQVLRAVAKAAEQINPGSSLLFLCGEFGKPKTAEKVQPKLEVKGATSQARRNHKRKQAARGLYAKSQKKEKGKQATSSSGLSARKACSILSELGITAQPLHVALGLESNLQEEEDDEDEEVPPFLVTFEGSARGLHFDGVDAVFVIGRPSSAAAYLHLAGRVGRAFAGDDGNVMVRPGTVVSICTKGSANELEKWTKQIGGLELKEM